MVNFWKGFIFLLMWTAYSSTVLLRRPLSVIKSDMESEFTLSKYELGLLDTAFLLPYAAVQTFLGAIGDYHGVRKTLALCLLVSAASMISFGEWKSLPMFLLLLFISGASQSLTWPTSTIAIDAWFKSNNKNIVFGFYGTSAFAGGIVGTILSVNLRTLYGWQNVHQIPALIVGFIALIIFVTFRKPTDVFPSQIKERQTIADNIPSNVQLSFQETWNIPIVADIVYASFFINFVRYCLLMWLPMYLFQQLNYSVTEAGVFSSCFEIGGVTGSISIGLIIDKLLKGKSLLGCTLYILLSAVFLLLFQYTSSYGRTYNMACIFMVGVCNCGVDTILTGSIPTHLGSMDGRNAGAAISGIVNGFGKIGTIIQGPIIGFIAQLYGWSGVLLFLVIISLLGGMLTLKAFRKMQCLNITGNN